MNLDLTGGSGFVSDEDGAHASLDINMSEDSARNLWDVQAAVQQIAVDFQTAVRAASDFQSYLISIREVSQTVKMPSLGMEGGEAGNMSYSGGRVDSGSVPLIQSEINQAQRIGEMEENQSGAGGGAMAARAPNARPVDTGGFINQMTQAAWMSGSLMGHQGQQGQGGMVRAPDGSLHPLTIDEGQGGAGGGGRGIGQVAGLLGQGRVAAQQFLRGGGAGGAAAMLGRLGTYGAIGYAGYQLVDAGLETYAQSRTMALSANNSQFGVGWGLGQRVGQATMAMSPFVSQEEAGQIYTSAINQGWASRAGGFQQGTFGQAVNFMYDAAKDYNIDPSMSSQLLQTNSLGAGQSVQALAEQLLTLKQTLDGTGVSMSAATANFTNFTGQLIAAGATGPMSAQVAGGALAAYAGNTYLGPSGRGAEIVSSTLGTQQTQNILAGLTGTIPGAALAGEGHLQASTAQLDKLTKRFTDQVMSMSTLDEAEKAAMFMQLYNGTFGTNIGEQDALNMMAVNASSPAALSAGQKKYLASSQMKLEHQSGISAWWHGLDDVQGWASTQTGNGQSIEAQERNSALINSYSNYSPEINTLLSNSGDLSKVVLYGPDGTPVTQDGHNVAGANIAKWFNDTENFNKFSARNSGYYIKDENGAKYNSSNIGTGGPDLTSNTGANDKNTVYIMLSAQAKQYLSLDKSQLTLDTGKNP